MPRQRGRGVPLFQLSPSLQLAQVSPGHPHKQLGLRWSKRGEITVGASTERGMEGGGQPAESCLSSMCTALP